MRKFTLAIAAGGIALAAAALASAPAGAVTLSTPAGVQSAMAGNDLLQEAAYVCRRRCGPNGCWRRCYHTSPAPYYGYYAAPVVPYYRHRYHRRHWW